MENTGMTVQVAGRYDCYLARLIPSEANNVIQVLDNKQHLANWVSITRLGRGVLEVTNLHTGTIHTLFLPDPGIWECDWQCDCQAARKGLPWCYHRAAAVAFSR